MFESKSVQKCNTTQRNSENPSAKTFTLSIFMEAILLCLVINKRHLFS
jgi:hypothetical protein